MKKVFILLVSLLAMMSASLSAKAQEVTINLLPGWNWISYTNAEAMDIAMAMGDFVPMEGDVIKSSYGFANYHNGSWIGGLQQFTPGLGYMYFSSRTSPVSFVYVRISHSLTVTTAEPTGITATYAVVSGTVTLLEGTSVFLRGVCYGTEPSPGFYDSHTTEGFGTGSFTSIITGLSASTTYYVRAYAVGDYGLIYGNEVSFTTEADSYHAYVDLGLPSGLLWATCNVGAEFPEEYGDYFSWGETQPKEYYDWDTYQYCHGSYTTLTKYCQFSYYGYNGFTDNLTTLLPEDDAATANWGGGWRMPTELEWEELCQNTTRTWTTRNGVKGLLFTAANGNSLFLPAAGFRVESGLSYDGSGGYYWSSSLESASDAYYLIISSGECYVDYYHRSDGYSVRPVHSTPPTGAIDGKFTINNSGDQVYFSQGNLQYIGSAATPYWKFADNQWDYFGATTDQNSSNQNVDRDLFGWGTSGWNNGNTYYRPWDTYKSSGSSYGPPGQYDLTGSYANADWGVYNPINNGGNQANQWRTLTQPEWAYVFDTRTTSSGIRYAKAKVNDVNGVILLPDDWNSDTYSLSDTNSNGANYSSNTITASQWNTLEQAGAVFLPIAGYRSGTSVNSVGSYGGYWSTSCGDSDNAWYVSFNGSNLYTDNNTFRYYGQSVRMVRAAE